MGVTVFTLRGCHFLHSDFVLADEGEFST
jgi:hypothetical protein